MSNGLFGMRAWHPRRGERPGNARSAAEAAARLQGMPRGQIMAPERPQDPQTVALATISTECPRIPWDVFVTEQFKWLPGEHVAILGPIGQGKTTMMYNVLPLHPYVVMFATKPRDKTMDRLLASGYHYMQRWQSLDPKYYPKRVLWPDASRMGSVAVQRSVFAHAFDAIYREGHWTVAIDELWYIIHQLKLTQHVKLYLLQARSLGISLCVGTQRPAHIPLEVYDQSTHLFFFRDNDETNLKRISGIAYRSAGLLRHLVSNLEAHQALYVNTRTGFMCRTRCPDIPAVGGETR